MIERPSVAPREARQAIPLGTHRTDPHWAMVRETPVVTVPGQTAEAGDSVGQDSVVQSVPCRGETEGVPFHRLSFLVAETSVGAADRGVKLTLPGLPYRQRERTQRSIPTRMVGAVSGPSRDMAFRSETRCIAFRRCEFF